MGVINQYQVAPVSDGTTFLTIAPAQTISLAPFNCQGVPPLGFVTSSAWLACNVTFLALPYLLSGVVYANNIPTNAQLAPVYDETDSGTIYTITTLAGYGYYRLPPILFNSVQWINITSSVTQTAGAQINLILAPIWQGIHH